MFFANTILLLFWEEVKALELTAWKLSTVSAFLAVPFNVPVIFVIVLFVAFKLVAVIPKAETVPDDAVIFAADVTF